MDRLETKAAALRGASCAVALAAALGAAETALAQDAGASGQELFDTHCALCHLEPPEDDIPTFESLQAMSANDIVSSLTDGFMRIQGLAMTPEEHVAVAEFITGGQVVDVTPAAFATGMCAAPPAAPVLAQDRVWNGWGGGVRNWRHQAASGLVAADVPKLALKWAFGIPGVTQSRSQPAVVGDRLFIASQSGAVYALDAETGCTFWTYEAEAGVRTAISVGPAGDGYAIYFADMQGRAYAVDAQNGRELWSLQYDDHPAARATGAPTLHDGVLYAVVSGVAEENAASMPDYECCTFRGSLTAIDAATGAIIWKTYTVPEPEPRGVSNTGKPLWGPAGSPIWAAPTIDAKRGLVYAASGNAYTDPVQETSDAIIAFSMETGAIEWINQITPNDTWILGCGVDATGEDPTVADANPNCPEDVGPDHDFSASPVLVTLADGRDVLVITQKAGVGYALDPDAEGAILWEYRWGDGSPVGGVWGASTDGERAYFAVADQFTPTPGGLHAVDLATGERAWAADPLTPLCEPGPGCSAAQSAALTSIPGVVFSGVADGGVRAYDSETGEVIWSFDANRAFDTVNGVEANGGSIDGPGPIVAGGMLYVTAGNGGFVGSPGNVLLAFEVVE